MVATVSRSRGGDGNRLTGSVRRTAGSDGKSSSAEGWTRIIVLSDHHGKITGVDTVRTVGSRYFAIVNIPAVQFIGRRFETLKCRIVCLPGTGLCGRSAFTLLVAVPLVGSTRHIARHRCTAELQVPRDTPYVIDKGTIQYRRERRTTCFQLHRCIRRGDHPRHKFVRVRYPSRTENEDEGECAFHLLSPILRPCASYNVPSILMYKCASRMYLVAAGRCVSSAEFLRTINKRSVLPVTV